MTGGTDGRRLGAGRLPAAGGGGGMFHRADQGGVCGGLDCWAFPGPVKLDEVKVALCGSGHIPIHANNTAGKGHEQAD